MRRQGKIAKWNDERGFGFISSAEGDNSVFVHISSFPRNERRPSVNETVSYILTLDANGRPRANDVRFTRGWRRAPSIQQILRRGFAQIAFAVSFLIALAVLATLGWLEMTWVALYYAASIITYGCYSRDKAAAEAADKRTPEATLHLLSLVGGWPGALIAQVRLRHKTRKPAFLVGYWFTVGVNCIVLGVIVRMRVSPLKALLGVAI